MTQDDLNYFGEEIAQLLNTYIEDQNLIKILDREGPDRINNAITRANRGETGALRFLQNCFPIEHAKGFVRQKESHNHNSHTNGQYHGKSRGYDEQNRNLHPQDISPEYDDSFPADQQNDRGSGSLPPQETAKEVQQTGDPEKYYGHHVYGSKGALYITANFKEKHDLNTIVVEGAPSVGIRKYDWNKKIRLQLTQEELPHFFAVITGMMPSCKLNNHGTGNNKALEIKDQGESWFVQIYAPNQNVAVKITPSDAFYVAQLVMKQMLMNAPWLDSVGMLNLVRMVVANRVVNKQSPQQQRGHS